MTNQGFPFGPAPGVIKSLIWHSSKSCSYISELDTKKLNFILNTWKSGMFSVPDGNV